MSGPKVAVLDYGIGNLRSAEKALQHVGADARLVSDPGAVFGADAVVLPGVGAFGACARALSESGLEAPARLALDAGVPFLAVCIGFQLLYDASEESPGAAGLGILSGTVRSLPAGEKHPQMQWNQLLSRAASTDASSNGSDLSPEWIAQDATSGPLKGLGEQPWVYFVHSYAPPVGAETVAVCDYGGPVAALVARREPVGGAVPPREVGPFGSRVVGQLRRLGGVSMELYPAIDLRGGTAVRLTQGDYGRETRYGDPVDLAQQWFDEGAQWLHVVDLDAARTGTAHERATLRQLVELAVTHGVQVEMGGGLRTEADVEEVLDLGVSRAVLGTAALEDPVWAAKCAERWPGRIAVGLDYQVHADGVAEALGHGWLAGGGRSPIELLTGWANDPMSAVVATSIARDGMLEGPDLDGLGALLAATEFPVIASGGVGTVEDLVALAQLEVDGRRLAGAIVGKALVEGRFSVKEALAACAASD